MQPYIGVIEPSLHVGQQDMGDQHEPLSALAVALDNPRQAPADALSLNLRDEHNKNTRLFPALTG